MAPAKKSKQSVPSPAGPLTTRSRAAAGNPRPDGLVNPHRKGTKASAAWEDAHPIPAAPAEPTAPDQPTLTPPAQANPAASIDQDLQGIVTRLKAIDDYTTDKWEGLDSLLDTKIEILAAAIASRLQPVIGPAAPGPSAAAQASWPAMPTLNANDNTPSNLTSQWNWIEDSVLTSIIDLKFDPINLHKLSPPEDVTHFNLSLEATAYGGFLVSKDGSVTAITGPAKLDKSLPTFAHWLSAFSVYASIRASYDRTGEMGPALFMFIREMNHYQLSFPWPQVLRYFLETFREYEKKSASVWREPFYRAYAKHMHHNTAPSTSAGASTARCKSPPTKSSGFGSTSLHKDSPRKRYSAEERAQQICQLYNLEDKGCTEPCQGGRRHVCQIKGCGKHHPVYEHK
jgi:hypothetical protein